MNERTNEDTPALVPCPSPSASLAPSSTSLSLYPPRNNHDLASLFLSFVVSRIGATVAGLPRLTRRGPQLLLSQRPRSYPSLSSPANYAISPLFPTQSRMERAWCAAPVAFWCRHCSVLQDTHSFSLSCFVAFTAVAGRVSILSSSFVFFVRFFPTSLSPSSYAPFFFLLGPSYQETPVLLSPAALTLSYQSLFRSHSFLHHSKRMGDARDGL